LSLADNFVARLTSLANRNFVAKLARIITNFNSGVLRESCENFVSYTNFSLWNMTLLVCESRKCETHKLPDSQAWRYIAFFPSWETRETRETHTDIFARSESHFLQNSREKYCETRLAVNPNCNKAVDGTCKFIVVAHQASYVYTEEEVFTGTF
jgi:hypothetical protein